ncbi:terpenoid synthase [Aspergillus vadensis CBS 113365]|uniref:(2E,6E)-farnesyl diphosphate synthase n=1 Tax=Aspergillus vadensis (strain CBS 113365 / IMI 142717 / IBT 24658) TaxID=1448311 RepID=A0A319BA21_ASPVC|nr:terpenoid synthase [Aspergillus vadensis CBS 113365]PYH69425.1 terpenoid synthase [Aspergillus vadensis CBS 113365]
MEPLQHHLPQNPLVFLALLAVPITALVWDRILNPLPTTKRAWLVGKKQPSRITSLECPYSYIRQIYGKHHWAPFVDKLAPNLKLDDPPKYRMILEIMDGIHLCLILVDDISDGSNFRKGHPAAHKIYGPSETANRAYYRVTQLLNRTVHEFPRLAPFLMQCLEEILEGQDMSLVWRRDGLASFPVAPKERDEAYRRMASLKTGALFRLLGQLVLEDQSMDATMTTVAWCSQLQNDCKNVYSTDYAKAKGALAEDLRNGEFSFPIVVALDAPEGHLVARALEYGSPYNIRNALRVIQREDIVRGPLDYLLKSPGKDIRRKFTHAFNEWLRIPEDKLNIITEIVGLLHTASLLIDDIQDNSKLRRGLPVAHSIFGIAQTINSANYAYFLAQERLRELNHPEAYEIYTEELLRLHRGQGMDLYWRDCLTCPTEEDYIEMIANKTGGLFRLAIKLMQLESETKSNVIELADLLGVIFQIRDDYQNLQSGLYTKNKGFCEDLTEGKFSFLIIHSINSNPNNHHLLNILRQRSEDDSVKKYAVEYINSTGSFDYCRERLASLLEEADHMVKKLENEAGQSKGIYDILSFLS